MKQLNYFSMVLCSAVAPQAVLAQAPSLEQKQTLPITLLENQTYSSNEVMVSKLTEIAPEGNYTLEVKGKFKSGTGRGLDIVANDSAGLGFRVSMDANSLNWNNPLNTFTPLSSSDNTKSRTFRFAVSGKNVSIYEDGYFLTTRPLEIIQESIISVDGNRPNVNPVLIPAEYWGNNTKPTPASMGWYIMKDGTEVTSWPNARFENSPSTQKLNNQDGSQYIGNFFFIRWDSDNLKNLKYAYEVELAANTTYDFSMDCAYWSNKTAGSTVTAMVSDNKLISSTIATHTFGTSSARQLIPGSFSFTTTHAGKYYIAFTGERALFAIANLKLTGQVAEPMVLIGKNYEGEATVEVEAATYDGADAYAPEEKMSEAVILNVADAGTIQKGFLFNTTVNVSGKTNLHLVGESAPYENSSINLTGDDAWLYFDYVKPSKVIRDYLSTIKINGQDAVDGTNCRVSVWDNGAVVIPNGPAYDKKALVAYDGENFTGNSKEFEIETYHNNLGNWDNKIKSFKLKKGYMATLANNANGTGYSRVFIANDHDLEISTLPEGMENFVSFVRVFRWNWPSKKGKANGYGEKDMLDITCNYDWNVGGKSDDPDIEYTPIRQNLGWPAWNDINNKKGVTHLLGCNEPDRTDQANATVDQVLEMWPEMLKSGLRLGSPAPSSIYTWVGTFFNEIEKLGYRCDFAVTHIYEDRLNANSLVDRVKSLSTKGKGRPVWITEWNNGANWTGEWWPTASGPKCDADSNPILDADGNTTIVSRPLSAENAEKNRKFMAEVLPALDKCDLLERYFEYDWVQDARALVLGGKLTPAGKVYGAHKAALAYTEQDSKPWENWKICPPFPIQTIDKDFRNITVKWYDHNGETGKKYVLERKMDDETEFKACKEFYLGTDYQAGETVVFTEAIPCTSTVTYRIKALSYKDTESEYSREKTFTRDSAVVAPTLRGEAISTTIAKLSWDAVDGAKTYRIERADSENGEYKVVADNLTATSYEDKDLKVNTTYYYRAYSLNSAAERPASEVISVTTKAFAVPEDIQGLRVSGGANSASLRWQFAYDTYYKVLRSDKENGSYVVIADKVDATSYHDEGLTNGQTYYYKVVPFNAAGEGNVSAVLSATPEAGKYMHLSFDENEGNVAYDEWGGNDGTFFNNASYVEGRNGGHAAKLTKGSKSYVELPKGAVSRLGDFTIAVWVKLPSNGGRLFDFGNGGSTFMMGAVKGSSLRYKITCAKGTFDYTAPAPWIWSSEGWNHFVMTQKGKDVKFYLNGELTAEATNEAEVYPKDLGITTQNWLGRSQWSSDAYCDHIYDDFRIYNYAVEADDVKFLFEDKEIVTGITLTEVHSHDVKNDAIYDLMGRKVSSTKNITTKGVYIQKGKKFVVK